jgi:UPF0716 protein FxsA
MRLSLFLFISIPIVEMYVLIQVGNSIGALPTVALVVLTATLGIWLLRLQGIATLRKVQEKISRGEIPGRELLEGIMLLIGGALLLTPGFVTDGIGFACLLPFLRRPIAQWLINKGLMGFLKFSQPVPYGQSNPGPEGGITIEGEFEDQTPHHNKNDNDNDQNNDKGINQ